jgi:hypothetical protein
MPQVTTRFGVASSVDEARRLFPNVSLAYVHDTSFYVYLLKPFTVPPVDQILASARTS